MKGKYESWGEFIKRRRELCFRSAREFCNRVNVGISYPQYSRYEAGDQLPNLDQALQLCKLLGVTPIEGILEWCRAQISEDMVRTDLEKLLDGHRSTKAGAEAKNEMQKKTVPAKPSDFSLDDLIVFNRSHLKVFTSDPAYRDIFTYVNSFSPEWISSSEISQAIGIPPTKLSIMLEKLNDLGVLLVAGEKCRSTKRNFYFPDDPEFFEIRNLNFKHNSADILRKMKHDDISLRKSYRGLVTRELTSDQAEYFVKRLDAVANEFVMLPETENPDRIYSMCLLLGARFERPKIKNTETGVRGVRQHSERPPDISTV
ncbi:MAG: hypothetical protein A2583_06885 [Bdellovibrionales bacterium RIFOXYD1_FULL_53_11]|nr:MAG: hypothetical protein A2583_06885 [Bdellovibrionales bacterium RIFOXYD1_FULL_53_11]